MDSLAHLQLPKPLRAGETQGSSADPTYPLFAIIHLLIHWVRSADPGGNCLSLIDDPVNHQLCDLGQIKCLFPYL